LCESDSESSRSQEVDLFKRWFHSVANTEIVTLGSSNHSDLTQRGSINEVGKSCPVENYSFSTYFILYFSLSRGLWSLETLSDVRSKTRPDTLPVTSDFSTFKPMMWCSKLGDSNHKSMASTRVIL